jgi:hypothetical protein
VNRAARFAAWAAVWSVLGVLLLGAVFAAGGRGP